MSDNIAQLKQLIDEAKRIVFFGGAGVSTESGLPDFRSPSGLAAKKYKYSFERILSHDFFFAHPNEFYDYYFAELTLPGIKPNAAHYALARLEAAKKLTAVVTQNIDGLHQAAGSKNVYELHGTVHVNYCTRCRRSFTLEQTTARRPVPHCDCGGLIKPDVVLYGEPLDDDTVRGALRELSEADLVIVGGTSLTVYPAAGFLGYVSGKIAVINKQPLVGVSPAPECEINDSIGKVLAACVT